MAGLPDPDCGNHFLNQFQIDIRNGDPGGSAIAGHCDGHIGSESRSYRTGPNQTLRAWGALYCRVGRHGGTEPVRLTSCPGKSRRALYPFKLQTNVIEDIAGT